MKTNTKTRKIIFCLFILTAALSCGCTPESSAGASNCFDAVSKAQEITIISEDKENSLVITGEEDVVNFVNSLEPEQWTLKTIPRDAAKTGVVRFSQEETVKLWQTKTSGDMYEVCSITVYSEPYIELKAAGMDVSFEINPETADYLNGYL